MKATLLSVAAAMGLAIGAVGATSVAANAHEWVNVRFGYGFGYGGYPYGSYPYPYPNNYYPNLYYPYEYYTPHAEHYYTPYYYPFYNSYSSYLVCNTIITTKVYWRDHKKYVVKVPLRSCYRVQSH